MYVDGRLVISPTEDQCLDDFRTSVEVGALRRRPLVGHLQVAACLLVPPRALVGVGPPPPAFLGGPEVSAAESKVNRRTAVKGLARHCRRHNQGCRPFLDLLEVARRPAATCIGRLRM